MTESPNRSRTPDRRLGPDGPLVSAIGFGAWAIGGPASRDGRPIGWGEVDDNESIAAVRAALDAGISFFDTANVYGAGHSERVLARALAGRRDEVVIATKFGNLIDEQKREAVGRSVAAEDIRQQCDESLSRLETDHIDLYQLHIGDLPLEQVDGVLEVLEELVAAGKIRSYGWSTDDPQRAEAFTKGPHCAAIQQSFSIVNGDDETLALCEQHGLASIVRGPLSMGLLTGKMTRDTTFAENDTRRFGFDWEGEHGRRLEALEKIRDVLTEDGRTLAQGALGWLLARSEAFIPIPGIRTVAQAQDNGGVLSTGPLTDDQMARIADALR
jgi:aryl-alcohol dehydrogenase-like predicted oxidoreductase